MSYFSHKVIPSNTIVEIENRVLSEKKVSLDFLIENAARAIVSHLVHFLSQKKHAEKKFFLLAGKGNKAADGFLTAILLKQAGYTVVAFTFYEEANCSEPCLKYRKKFQEIGGEIEKILDPQKIYIDESFIIIDALFGTGFSGKLQGKFLEIVQKINRSKKAFVLAIDIPTGVDGNSGKVLTDAIRCNVTVTFTLPKLGLFLNDGPNFSGKVFVEDVGIPKKYFQQIETPYFIIDESCLKTLLPPLLKKRHKYEAGFVVGIAGSFGMTGAANLAGLAALRTGAGLVKIFSKDVLKNPPYELINKTIQSESFDAIVKECNKASALFIGPGLGREADTEAFLLKLFPKIFIPTVLDADGLFFLSNHSELKLFQKTILTPHKQEMLRLLKIDEKNISDEELWERCAQFAKEKEITLVLKGYPTLIFDPTWKTIICLRGDPAMATAGSGDVLTGMLAALLAQKLPPYEAAILGVFLHAISGERAANLRGHYGVIASDLIDYLAYAFKKIQKRD